MSTPKRQRKREGTQARQAAAAAAARRRQTQRTRLIAGVFLVIVLAAGLAIVVGGGKDGTDVAGTGPTTTLAPPTTGAASIKKTPVSLPPLAAGASIKGDTPCPPPDGSAPRTTNFEKAPPLCVAVAKTYAAEIQTSKGLMVVNLDVKGTTRTVNNFVVLARYHYFDGIAFHRILPGFVIQGGDPLQTGLGGPGYKFEDELPKAGAYKVGSLAMANSGPNTNGSQFFIVTGEFGITSLQPLYSLFGQVTQGLEVVKAIDDVAIPGNAAGTPSEVVTIRSVTIKET